MTDERIFDFDDYKPAQIARNVEVSGVAKAELQLLPLVVLAMLAGFFIAVGAALYTLVVTDSPLGFGPTRLLGGMAFSLGLILVVVGGAELFTGNNLLVMAWVQQHVTTRAVLRNWGVSYIGNAAGAFMAVILIELSGILALGSMGETAAGIAAGKLDLSPLEAFTRGILCNALVCMAVWLSYAARHVTGKVIAILFPITAFVALGFEHSVANFYLLPIGLLNGAEGTVSDVFANLIPVTLGNIVGGAGGVALVYWAIYLRGMDVR